MNENFSHFGVPDEYQDKNKKVEPSNQAKFDGYAFGDRMLEGVMFVATIEEDKTLSVAIDPDSADYFSDLNEKKWLKEALNYALENDMFEGMNGDEGDINLIRTDGTMNYDGGGRGGGIEMPVTPIPIMMGKIKL